MPKTADSVTHYDFRLHNQVTCSIRTQQVWLLATSYIYSIKDNSFVSGEGESGRNQEENVQIPYFPGDSYTFSEISRTQTKSESTGGNYKLLWRKGKENGLIPCLKANMSLVWKRFYSDWSGTKEKSQLVFQIFQVLLRVSSVLFLITHNQLALRN